MKEKTDPASEQHSDAKSARHEQEITLNHCETMGDDNGRMLETASSRFFSKVKKTETCWEWLAGKDKDGYGRFSIKKKEIRSHRFSYALYKGPIPEGMELDHLCRNPSCVNPDHLEAVTSKINLLRGQGSPAQNARKTHCKNGHEFTQKNTRVKKIGERKERICRQCEKEWTRLFRARKQNTITN